METCLASRKVHVDANISGASVHIVRKTLLKQKYDACSAAHERLPCRAESQIAALHWGPVIMSIPGSAVQSKRLAHQQSHLDRQLAPFSRNWHRYAVALRPFISQRPAAVCAARMPGNRNGPAAPHRYLPHVNPLGRRMAHVHIKDD